MLPHGECAADGIARQNSQLDGFAAPGWFNLRPQLAAAAERGEQFFWKTDTDWTTRAGERYARAVAEQLDPDLEGRITVQNGPVTRLGDLFVLAGLTFKETAPGVRLTAGGEVTETAGSNHFDPLTVKYEVNKWRTTPGDGLIPGRSLVIGDSFTYYLLGTLRPLFANGTFFLTGNGGSNDAMLDQIERADTVLLEVVQRSVGGGYLLFSPSFRKQLAARLGVEAGS